MTLAPALHQQLISAPGTPLHHHAPTEQGKRIEQSIATGSRVSSDDISLNAGWYVRVPHGLLTVLCQAHGLSGTQYRYLLTVYQHSLGINSPVAIKSLRDRRPPTIQDWQQWLNLPSAKQIYNTRRELQRLGIIVFAEGKSDYIAINVHWESWDAKAFTRQVSRRKVALCSRKVDIQLTLPLVAQNAEPDIHALFLYPEADMCELPRAREETSSDIPVVICKCPATTDEARPEEAEEGFTKKATRDTQEVTDANASGAPRTPITLELSPTTLEQDSHERRPRRSRRPLPQKKAQELSRPSPVHPMPPPLSHDELPGRLNGETTRAFWLRCYHQVAGDAGAEQHLAHRCAQAELGLALTDEGTLSAKDCQLLGQLQHDAGNWGTVIHWLIECATRAVVEPRGYLHGMARRHREQQAHPHDRKPCQGKQPLIFPVTETSALSVGEKMDNGVLAANDVTEIRASEAVQFPPLDEPTNVQNIVRRVYAWPYPVGRDLHLSTEQSEVFVAAAAAILADHQAPIETCRWRAERAARMAQLWYPQSRGPARAAHILEGLRQRW